jgi:ribonuclease VapC
VIVDSSAIIAILKEEQESDAFMTQMANADRLEMSAATYLEAAIVTDSNGDPVLSERLDKVIGALAITIAPVTESQAKTARAAYRTFGKGNGHPAGLNFGDCFSYALAMERKQPLLFKGNDFGQTDVVPAQG